MGPADLSHTGSPVGLALAGGGPEGAVYEIGALRALDEALEGLDLNRMFVYVGVSAGAFVSACLANQMTTAQMCRAIVRDSGDDHPFSPEFFLTPAVGEWVRRGMMTPEILLRAFTEHWANPRDRTLLGSMTRLSRALPVGLFDNEPMRKYLEKIFSLKDRSDDFRRLASRLIIVAADLDSGTAVRFGDEGLRHVPISRAVQASTALPGLYPPVEIDGRYFVDGVLLKTLHASVALDAGAELLLCVNPIVPVDTEETVARGVMRTGKLVRRGLPTVLSQTFRTMVHSRLRVGMKAYAERYPASDVILFEPDRDDYRMFFTNIFSFSSRKAVCEHAYRSVRRQLLARRAELEPILRRHGIRLRMEVLLEERDLWSGVGLTADAASLGGPVVTQRLSGALSRLDSVLDHLESRDRGIVEHV